MRQLKQEDDWCSEFRQRCEATVAWLSLIINNSLSVSGLGVDNQWYEFAAGKNYELIDWIVGTLSRTDGQPY